MEISPANSSVTSTLRLNHDHPILAKNQIRAQTLVDQLAKYRGRPSITHPRNQPICGSCNLYEADRLIQLRFVTGKNSPKAPSPLPDPHQTRHPLDLRHRRPL
jgi:hypothetical protein